MVGFQLSEEDIRHLTEEVTDAKGELSKNDFILHVKVTFCWNYVDCGDNVGGGGLGKWKKLIFDNGFLAEHEDFQSVWECCDVLLMVMMVMMMMIMMIEKVANDEFLAENEHVQSVWECRSWERPSLEWEGQQLVERISSSKLIIIFLLIIANFIFSCKH